MPLPGLFARYRARWQAASIFALTLALFMSKLPTNGPAQLIVPVSAKDLKLRQGRLTLYFSEFRRRSFLDIRQIAAQLQSLQIGLHSPSRSIGERALGGATTAHTGSPADAASPSARLRPAP
jgi:hypothetical protein